MQFESKAQLAPTHTFDQIQLKFLRNDAMNFLHIFDK